MGNHSASGSGGLGSLKSALVDKRSKWEIRRDQEKKLMDQLLRNISLCSDRISQFHNTVGVRTARVLTGEASAECVATLEGHRGSVRGVVAGAGWVAGQSDGESGELIVWRPA